MKLTAEDLAAMIRSGQVPLPAQSAGAQLIKKAVDPLVTSDFDAGSLKQELADTFINQVVDLSTFLKLIRVHKTDAPSGEIAKLNITGPVTGQATENTKYDYSHKPSNTNVAFATKKTVSAIDISGEVGEDNIEGESGKTKIMTAFVDQVSNDMEQLGLEGDESIVAVATATQRLLKANDGFHTLCVDDASVNDVDAGGLRGSYALLTEMVRTMPNKWLRNPGNLRFFVCPQTAMDLQSEWAGRLTDMGDKQRTTDLLPPAHGIQIVPIPMLPNDLAINGTSGSTGTFIWLADPKNFVYVVQRALTIEWNRVARSDTDEGTLHMRTDFIIEEGASIVMANNVNVNTAVALYS